MRTLLLSLAGVVFLVSHVAADELGDVRLIQEIYETPVLAAPGYAQLQTRIDLWSFQGSDAVGLVLGGQGAYLVMPSPVGGLEVGVVLGFATISPEEGDSESGLLDINVVGKYLFLEEPLKVAAGGVLSLPIGKEELFAYDAGGFDIELFGATRYDLDAISLEGHFGFRINGSVEYGEYETYDPTTWEIVTRKLEREGELSIKIGGGAIYSLSPAIALLGELTIETSRYKNGDDDIRLTGGVDLRLLPSLAIRPGLSLGLSDGAPDFEILGGIALALGG